MPTEYLSFENGDGQLLSARLDLPVDGEAVAFAVFAHCFTCGKNLRAATNISRALTRHGIGVLRFDFTGLGESEGDFADSNFSSNVDDIIAAASFLERAYGAPQLLLGHSLGGAAVLHAASRIAHVKAVATIGAPFDPNHVVHLFNEQLEEIQETGSAEVSIAGRAFRVKRQFVEDLQSQRASTVLDGLRKPILIFHAPLDAIVGIENAGYIFKRAKHPKSYISLDTADHLLSATEDSVYVGDVLAAWAKKYVGAPQASLKHTELTDNAVVAHIDDAGYKTELLANGFPLVADEPVEVGGTNAGPTPYDYVVSGLGACTAMTLRMYADRKGWPLEGVDVLLNHKKVHRDDCVEGEKKSRKIDLIERELVLHGPLEEKQRQRLTEIANRCPVHRTLEGKVEITTSLVE